MNREIDRLLAKARSATSPDAAARLWKSVLDINPRHAEALVEYGILLLNDEKMQEDGFTNFQLAFEPTAEPRPQDVHSYKGFTIAWHLGRRQTLEYADQKRFLLLAASSEFAADDCIDMMLATLLPNHAESPDEARLALDEAHERMDRLLAKPQLRVDAIRSDNPWHVCMFGGFLAAVFYERNIKTTVEKMMQIGIKAVPSLIYVSPHLKRRPPLGPIGKVKMGLASSMQQHVALRCGMLRRIARVIPVCFSGEDGLRVVALPPAHPLGRRVLRRHDHAPRPRANRRAQAKRMRCCGYFRPRIMMLGARCCE
jgi:hypothetical protein